MRDIVSTLKEYGLSLDLILKEQWPSINYIFENIRSILPVLSTKYWVIFTLLGKCGPSVIYICKTK